MLNNIIVSGYVGKITKDGKDNRPFSFTLCSSRNFLKDGEWISRDEWFLVTYFGKGKDRIASSCSVGDYFEIMGEIINYEHDGKRGYYINASYISKVSRSTSKEEEKETSSSEKDEDDEFPF